VAGENGSTKTSVVELLSGFMLYGGMMFVLVGVMSCVNTALDLELEMFDSALPSDWVAALFLLGLGAVLTVLGWAVGRWRNR
jgi:hypothetical protein